MASQISLPKNTSPAASAEQGCSSCLACPLVRTLPGLHCSIMGRPSDEYRTHGGASAGGGFRPYLVLGGHQHPARSLSHMPAANSTTMHGRRRRRPGVAKIANTAKGLICLAWWQRRRIGATLAYLCTVLCASLRLLRRSGLTCAA